MSGKEAVLLKLWISTWDFSWHNKEMEKEDALQEGLPIHDEAAIWERVLRKDVEATDLSTLKDFFRFQAAASKGMIQEIRKSDLRLP
jgi:hypothetical protein